MCYINVRAEDCTSVKEVNGTECEGVFFPNEIEEKARAEHSILLQEREQCKELEKLREEEVGQIESKCKVWEDEAKKQAEIAQKNANGFRNGFFTGSGVTAVLLTVLKLLILL